MDVQFSSSGLEVDIAKWLESVDLQLREFHKHASITSEAFKVRVALLIQIGTHPLDLKISHVTYSSAQRAFMSPWTPELKTLNQTSRRKHLPGCTYNLSKTDITGKDADNVGAPCNPNNRLVFVGI